MPEIRYSYRDAPTVKAFSESDSFVRGLMGPFRSGKSSGCVVEGVRRAHAQQPGPDGIRRSRWLIVRNTYRQLEDTAARTVFDWLPPRFFGDWNKADHIYHVTGFEGVDLEILFRALDRPDHVRNLLSLEVTFAWINEAREVPWSIIEAIQGRVGQYPSMKDGGPTWWGLWLDTNPPDEDSQWFRFFEEERPSNARLFKQPSGLSEDAENTENLIPNYYENLAEGKSPEWQKVYIHGEYGFVVEGKPVYPEYSDTFHCRECSPVQGKPIRRGWDFGLTPACTFSQMLPSGQWIVFDEMVSSRMGIDRFSDDVLAHCAQDYPGYEFEDFGDPAGRSASETDERSCFQVMEAKGISIEPGEQTLSIRLESVRKPLNSLRDGEPAMVIHPRCKTLRKGFMGGYQFRKMQTSDEKYTEKPDKNQYSHCFVAGTPVSTPHGVVPIEQLREGDEVTTPIGPRRVTATMDRVAEVVEVRLTDGRVIRSTPDHEFWLHGGFVCADALQYGDTLKQEGSPWDDQEFTQFRNSRGFGITASPMGTLRPTARLVDAICTALFGSITTARFQTGTASTTLTMTRPTTIPTTWPRCQMESIQPITGGGEWEHWKPLGIWTGFVRRLRNGINQRKGGTGIGNTQSGSRQNSRSNLTSAFGVNQNIRSSVAPGSGGTVRPAARRLQGGPVVWMMKHASALSAVVRSRSTSTARHEHAATVAGLRFTGERSRVYDLTVAQAHSFFANGVLVSNCHDALQYDASKLFGPGLKEKPRMGKTVDWTRQVSNV